MRPRLTPLPSLGDKFGKYTVIEHPTNSQKILCRCDCGTTRKISAYHLRNRPNLSCGCDVGERISQRKRTHGMARRGKNRSPEYALWASMMARCYNPNSDRYYLYGAKGVTVCERWHDFVNFLADMGKRPSPSLSLDRFPNTNGDYEPGNVRWATDEEQRNNKRVSVFLEYGGERLTVAQWSRKTGIPDWHIRRQKKRGWDDAEIIDGRAIGPKRSRDAGGFRSAE